MRRNPQHLAGNGDADLESNAGQKSDQHRLREEVGQKAESEQSRQQEAGRRQQRHQPGQLHVVLAGYGRHVGEPAARIAAVAESAATTRYREEPNVANAIGGRSSV